MEATDQESYLQLSIQLDDSDVCMFDESVRSLSIYLIISLKIFILKENTYIHSNYEFDIKSTNRFKMEQNLDALDEANY